MPASISFSTTKSRKLLHFYKNSTKLPLSQNQIAFENKKIYSNLILIQK
jgi:hypothetical protein